MLVDLKKASSWNTNDEKEKYEKLGFIFERDDWDKQRPWYDVTKLCYNIQNIDDIYNFVSDFGSVVIRKNSPNNATEFSVIIYDDYLE